VWAEVWPTLNAQVNPQRLDYFTIRQSANVGTYDSSQDAYTPSIVGTDEDDIVLVFNGSAASGSDGYPGVYYTGQKASQSSSAPSSQVIGGTHATTATWGKYSACAISLNSVTRGGIWCVGEYAGATPDPGWNTRLFNLRAE
jgi:hypothetical protein